MANGAAALVAYAWMACTITNVTTYKGQPLDLLHVTGSCASAVATVWLK